MTTSTTDAEAIREAFAKVVVESDRDWSGNVASYRKYLVDRLTDCGLFVLASRREAQEPECECPTLEHCDGSCNLPPPQAGEVERLRAALEIIAGERQCLDNLMSNADVARAALNGGREKGK